MTQFLVICQDWREVCRIVCVRLSCLCGLTESHISPHTQLCSRSLHAGANYLWKCKETWTVWLDFERKTIILWWQYYFVDYFRLFVASISPLSVLNFARPRPMFFLYRFVARNRSKSCQISYLNRPLATRYWYIVLSAGLMMDLMRCRALLLPCLLPRNMQAFSMHTAWKGRTKMRKSGNYRGSFRKEVQTAVPNIEPITTIYLIGQNWIN